MMRLPPDLIRLRREKVPAQPAPPDAVKKGGNYDGPSSGYSGAKSGYDGRRGSPGQSSERYDGPEKGPDGPEPSGGRVKPSGPDRR